jgi:small subunit ribosomal protein S17
MAVDAKHNTTPEKAGQEKVGEVVSTKMTKTIVVEVIRRVKHPLYQRVVTKRRRFYAHDDSETAKTGDVVRIVEHRPLSRLKRWALAEVIRKAVVIDEAHLVATVKDSKKKAAPKKGSKA